MFNDRLGPFQHDFLKVKFESRILVPTVAARRRVLCSTIGWVQTTCSSQTGPMVVVFAFSDVRRASIRRLSASLGRSFQRSERRRHECFVRRNVGHGVDVSSARENGMESDSPTLCRRSFKGPKSKTSVVVSAIFDFSFFQLRMVTLHGLFCLFGAKFTLKRFFALFAFPLLT